MAHMQKTPAHLSFNHFSPIIVHNINVVEWDNTEYVIEENAWLNIFPYQKFISTQTIQQ